MVVWESKFCLAYSHLLFYPLYISSMRKSRLLGMNICRYYDGIASLIFMDNTIQTITYDQLSFLNGATILLCKCFPYYIIVDTA